MIEGNRINGHEFVEVVLERDVVPVPSNHVERAVVLLSGEQFAVVLANDLVICFTVLVTRDRSLKIPWIRQAVRSCSKRQRSRSHSDRAVCFIEFNDPVYLLAPIRAVENGRRTLPGCNPGKGRTPRR